MSREHVSRQTPVAGVEAGGTKVRVAVGTGPGDVETEHTIATTDASETLDAVVRFLRSFEIASVGIGAFGPIDLDPASVTYGCMLETPKPGWSGADVVSHLRDGLGVPVAVDTDVGAAALAEHRWGSARGVDHLVYLTVGTGIGAGVIIDGRVHHGRGHPEGGHIPVAPEADDGFSGTCPFHGGCLEGMAAGPAIEARWGSPGQSLGGRAEVWDLEARYLAQAVRAFTYAIAPQRVVLGGGVMRQPGLIELLRRHLERILGGYASSPTLLDTLDSYVVGAELGQDAGLMGAIALGTIAAGVR